MKRFDVLVLGGGSAGSVLAARLSETAERRVGLVEAGQPPADPDIADPLKWPMLQGRSYDWAYATVPQAGTAGRIHPWPRGRILGGSSCLHAMAHVRGHPDDFERWAEASGSRRWSYEGLLPGFVRSERFSGRPHPRHGADGPLPVHLPDAELSPVVSAYMDSGRSLGFPDLGDHNLGPLRGVAPNSLTIRDGRRVSAADAYLTPAVLARANLSLLTGARIHRLEIAGDRVTSVVVEAAGEHLRLEADRVILSLGSIGSPLLLMRSGLGPEAALRAAGILPRLHRPDIGGHLHDHLLTAGNVYRASRAVAPSRLQHSESLTYLGADDPAAAAGSPDVVVACVAAPTTSERLEAPAYGSAYTLLSGVTHPTSRGRLAVTGPDLGDAPSIDPAYLSTEHDRRLARRALEIAREIGAAGPLAGWRAAEVHPAASITGTAALDAFIAEAVITHHHPVGTCRMGADEEAVVDPDLKLRGLSNAFVVDASVIPAITSGPVHAAVLAIAETFAAEVVPNWT